MRMSGPIRTAIMSFATCSPDRTPGFDLLKAVAHSHEQAFTRLGRGDAACGASRQPKAESCLQPANGVAQR